MYVSKIHSCRGQEAVVLEEKEPPAPKCSCRLIINITEATAIVKRGEAKWIVVSRTRGVRDVICSHCKGGQDVKICAKCSGTGKQEESYTEDIPGTDIVYTSADSVDESERKKRKWLAPKTPRVATIESEHIERAYVSGVKEAVERIEEYGMLIIKDRLRQLAVGVTNEEFEEAWAEYEDANYPPYSPVPIRFEPDNNAMRGEGRDFDYGRSV
jgi:RecJ-like exonuclease